MSLATIVGPFGSTGPDGLGWAAADEQAALIAARATRPRVRRRRFMSGCSVMQGLRVAGPGGGRVPRGGVRRPPGPSPAAAELRDEQGELALDDR